MPSDLDSARRGDLRAFDRLAAAYYEQLYTLSYRVLGKSTAAADAAQAGLAQAARHMRSFEGGPLQLWLLRWVVRACRERLREGEAGAGRPNEGSPAGPEPSLQTSLGALPSDQRLAILLVDVTGLDYAAAAAVLGLSRQQVRQRVAQARERLRHAPAA